MNNYIFNSVDILYMMQYSQTKSVSCPALCLQAHFSILRSVWFSIIALIRELFLVWFYMRKWISGLYLAEISDV